MPRGLFFLSHSRGFSFGLVDGPFFPFLFCTVSPPFQNCTVAGTIRFVHSRCSLMGGFFFFIFFRFGSFPGFFPPIVFLCNWGSCSGCRLPLFPWMCFFFCWWAFSVLFVVVKFWPVFFFFFALSCPRVVFFPLVLIGELNPFRCFFSFLFVWRVRGIVPFGCLSGGVVLWVFFLSPIEDFTL